VETHPRTQRGPRTLGKQTGAELSAFFVRCCLVAPCGLCRPVWISRMTKPAEDRVAGEFNPAGRLKRRCRSRRLRFLAVDSSGRPAPWWPSKKVFRVDFLEKSYETRCPKRENATVPGMRARIIDAPGFLLEFTSPGRVSQKLGQEEIVGLNR